LSGASSHFAWILVMYSKYIVSGGGIACCCCWCRCC
jgi:hypothetical protein